MTSWRGGGEAVYARQAHSRRCPNAVLPLSGRCLDVVLCVLPTAFYGAQADRVHDGEWMMTQHTAEELVMLTSTAHPTHMHSESGGSADDP